MVAVITQDIAFPCYLTKVVDIPPVRVRTTERARILQRETVIQKCMPSTVSGNIAIPCHLPIVVNAPAV